MKHEHSCLKAKRILFSFLHITSTQFNILKSTHKFALQIHKMQTNLLVSLQANRSKLSYLTMIWEQQLVKQLIQLTKNKSKRKENLVIRDQIKNIPDHIRN